MQTNELLEAIEGVPFELGMWGVLGITLIVFGVYSAVLLWHWRIYSTGKFTTVSNMLLYLGVSGIFLVLMAGAAVTYGIL